MSPSHLPVPTRFPAPGHAPRLRGGRRLGVGALLLSAAVLAGPLLAQEATGTNDPPLGGADLTVMTLGSGVSAIGGGLDGSVLVVEGGGQALVVDGQGPSNWSNLVSAVTLATKVPVRWVVNTHYHADHVGANAHYGAERVPIVAHARTAEYLSRAGGVADLGWEYEALPHEGRPTVRVEGDTTIKLGEREVRLIHMPAAHTDGDLVVHVPDADVIHTGDIFDFGNYPFVDLWHGGSTDGMIAAVDRILGLCTPDTHVLPGHGPPAGRDELQAYRDMLVGVRGKVEAALDADQSLDELISTVPTGNYDGTFGQPGSGRRLVALFYQDLSERRAIEAAR